LQGAGCAFIPFTACPTAGRLCSATAARSENSGWKEILVSMAEQDQQKNKRDQERRLLTDELARRLRAAGIACEVHHIKIH
jgi:hypothetical protein